jgi:threonine dehydrogenase-like Zn-dependent dehydrogenase
MVQINMQKIVTTENTIVGTHIYTLEEFIKCLRLLEDGAVDVKPIITGSYPLAEGAEAFHVLENNAGGKNLKLMLRM